MSLGDYFHRVLIDVWSCNEDLWQQDSVCGIQSELVTVCVFVGSFRTMQLLVRLFLEQTPFADTGKPVQHVVICTAIFQRLQSCTCLEGSFAVVQLLPK